ncbi:hypothetical protein F511_39811 [Dorcoceras hygrometricum]|uniref:Uncharacterized protein n=1 Tax=Dorcoceras hygrometricum TaxID=472368 RepID=A0A2Z7BWK4_9LAMI|nr:hypothetical protein F511_39811 [Dorcoceras hygrometricum]
MKIRTYKSHYLNRRTTRSEIVKSSKIRLRSHSLSGFEICKERTGWERGVQRYQPCSKERCLPLALGEDKVQVHSVEGFAMGTYLPAQASKLISTRDIQLSPNLTLHSVTKTICYKQHNVIDQHRAYALTDTGLTNQLRASQTAQAKSARFTLQLRHQINLHYSNQYVLLNSTVLPDQLRPHQIITARSAHNSISLHHARSGQHPRSISARSIKFGIVPSDQHALTTQHSAS